MKYKRQILVLSLFILIVVSGMLLTSCDLFNLGSSTTGTAPTITKVSILKTDYNYLTSKEYLYNKDSENTMPINSGESFLISIEYENPSDYSISYLKLNNEKIMATRFEEGSSKTNTIIKVTASESKTTLEESYIVNSIYYNAGSETKKLTFNDAYPMTFNVVIEPSYYLTLNFQNADRRVATESVDQFSTKQMVKFGAELSNYSIVDKNYLATAGLPTKAGGWVFEGYFTKPNGGGESVESKDKYYFWSDITLYAYFTRIYTYEIVTLASSIGKDSIIYEYEKDKKTLSKTFYSGVIITGDTHKGHPVLDLANTMVDEVVKVNENTGVATVTAIEYPIIKVGKEAFNNVNTIFSLNIGKYIEEIGYYAFNNCNALEKVVFASGSELKYIGDFAFQDTTLMGITYPFAIPDKVEYLGNFAFRLSGWKNTINNGSNESILHIYPQYKFIGAECFSQTKFAQVIFEPGCYYESQINLLAAEALDDNGGWKTIDTTKNQIGASLFSNCSELTAVKFKNVITEGVVTTKALNIIPDGIFNGGNYTIKGLQSVEFNEGVEIIGEKAFNYQEILTELVLPASVKDIGKSAFYNCIKVVKLEFAEGSQLTTLRGKAFGNMASISRVIITSSVFTTYGNGPFEGCGTLKSIEFPNITEIGQVPKGFDNVQDDSEVKIGHEFSDFLYGTFENGEATPTTGTTATEAKTYSVPTRIFCNKAVIAKFKDNILDGKELHAGATETSPRSYRDTIFVYDINLIFRGYKVNANDTNSALTDIALQEIYNVSGTVIGYNLAFWSDRSKEITIPSKLTLTINDDTRERDIIEIGMYSMPNCVQKITVPSSVTRLEHDAFNNCTSLTEVIFNDKNTLVYIGENAFMGTGITSFTGGSNLKAIGQYAFSRCKALAWVDLSACTEISNVQNGRKVLKSQYKFDYELTEINKENPGEDGIDYDDALYYGAFQGCKLLTWIYMPPTIARMSRSLFTGCELLRTVIIATPYVSAYNSTTDEDESCFYENGQATTVYDSIALSQGMTIYGYNIDSTHQKAFEYDHYVALTGSNYPAHS